MSKIDLSSKWNEDSLSDVCDVEFGTRVVKKRDAGSIYPVYGGGGATFFMDTFNRENRMVIARFAMSEKCTRFVRGKFFLNDSGLTISPKKSNLLIDKFLNYQIKSLNDKIYSIGRGAAQRNLNTNEFKKLKILYPFSIKEQKRIVKKLDESFDKIDKAIENTKKNIKNTKELFQSKLNETFTNFIEGWDETTIGKIGKVSMCKRILKNQTYTAGDIPFYKIGTFGKKANAFIDKETFNLFIKKYSYPNKGDILISASGTIGRRVIFDGKPSYFQDSNIVWIANEEKTILNKYLYHFYSFWDWNPSKGATIKRLYNGDLRRIKIRYPISQIKQKEIINNLDKLSDYTKKLESTYNQKLLDLEELKKSILDKAFKGEL